jgi:hypothetical protein
MPLWSYLENGGRRAIQIAHRRWGKDDVALHRTSIAANAERVGTYWHMLPKASQSRKAIWEAVNARTGKRRIDEAFPKELRDGEARETDMFIRFKSGSTWQVVGSDNFDSLVGSPPIGIVLSEWALADPRAWAILSPILEENKGSALFITTPRGRNHALKTLELAKSEPDWFWDVKSAYQTPVFTPAALEKIKREYIKTYGNDDGVALFDQEYGCSFDAALVGAYYAKQIELLEAAGRIRTNIAFDPSYPVETAWDLGFSDDCAIWFFQVVAGEVRILGYYANHGQDIGHYANVLTEYAQRKGWKYWFNEPNEAFHWVPWDARPKTLASGGKSLLEIAWSDHQLRLRVGKQLSLQDGIQAVRRMLSTVWFDRTECETGLDSLRNYQREWDDDRKIFKTTPLHNWASHGSDAFRYLAIAAQQREPVERRQAGQIKRLEDMTFDELAAMSSQLRKPEYRV